MDSGIYKIENIVTGKCYYGSAVSIRRRWYEHQSCARRGIHRNPKFQSAWNKYGEAAFAFSILLVCSKEHLLLYEQLVLDGFDAVRTGYNLAPTAGNSLGIKQSAEHRARISAARLGMKLDLSDEVRQKKRDVMLGNKYSLGSSTPTKPRPSVPS